MKSSCPRFFRFFDPETCATDLEFPQHVQISLPKTVSLQDRYYNVWQVNARKVVGSLYFLDGWEDFVKDNSLEKYDMLRFQYTEEGLFDVKLYGLSGCEKIGVGHRKHSSTTPNVMPVDSGNSEQPRRKKRVLDWRGADIFGNEIPEPQGLYIVRRFGANRKNEFYIPKELLRDRELTLPKKLKLVDPVGRTFTTLFRQWYDARSFYIGGWNRLLRKNGITKDDICICEFDHETRPKCIYVSFLKVDRSL